MDASRARCLEESVRADSKEMARLVKDECCRTRVSQELRQWRDRQEDILEMAGLLGSCRSSRVLSELQSWTEGLADKFDFSPAARHTHPAVLQDARALPVVALAGCRGMGQERLLRALCGKTEHDGSQCASLDGNAMQGVIETKYYSARVQYVLLKLDGDEAPGSSDLRISERWQE
eukprot:TRINITY_DN6877_c0_g1_i2.p1 TRINITY_DN6877_c0_g1~~TRINITY_DN6877_c0_g1_i2.p1  ORF type:complete len:203 (-),score=41.88 TRINITY_DN6877_c0_g1_i2:94-621(-)